MRGTGSEKWKRGEQRKKTSTTLPLHNPTRKDGPLAARDERQNQRLPQPRRSRPPFQESNPKTQATPERHKVKIKIASRLQGCPTRPRELRSGIIGNGLHLPTCGGRVSV